VHNFFQKKDNQKERIARRVWALAIMLSVSDRLVTLILFIAAIFLSGCFVCHRENDIKGFFRIKPKSIPSVSSGVCSIFLSVSFRMYANLFRLFPLLRSKKFFNKKNKSKKVLIEIMVDRSAELALQESMRNDLDNV